MGSGRIVEAHMLPSPSAIHPLFVDSSAFPARLHERQLSGAEDRPSPHTRGGTLATVAIGSKHPQVCTRLRDSAEAAPRGVSCERRQSAAGGRCARRTGARGRGHAGLGAAQPHGACTTRCGTRRIGPDFRAGRRQMQKTRAGANAWRSLAPQPLEGTRGAAPSASRTSRRARLRAGPVAKAPRRRAAAQCRPCHVHVGGAGRRATARATRGGPRWVRRSRWAGPAAARSWPVPTASQAATDQHLSAVRGRDFLCQCAHSRSRKEKITRRGNFSAVNAAPT